jgi:outer membrane receptor protein involved in Fe transport
MGSHDFKAGVEYTHSEPYSSYGYCGGKYYMDYAGMPYLLYTQDIPSTSDHKHDNLSLFVQDSWTLTKRLTFNLGLRYEHYRYNVARTGRGLIYNTGSLSPRIGFALDLLGDQKTVLKIHYGHYYDKLRLNYFYYADYGTVSRTNYIWTGDEWSEIYSVTPDPFRYQVDPDIKHPFVREISAGIERDIFKNASLNISFYYRKTEHFVGVVNTAARWQKVTINNPGYDGVNGTADDMGPIDVYQQLNPGEDAYLITNPRKGQADSMIDDLKHTAKGIQITFNKRFSNRWQLNATYHYTHVLGNSVDVEQAQGSSPNYFVNAYGHIGYFYGWPHQFKLQGVALLPLDIRLGLSAEYVSGENMQPYFSGMVGSTYEYINIEPPGKTKYESRKNVDIRIEKVFDLKDLKLTLMADVYNVFNSDRVTYATRRVSANFSKLIFVTPPRTFRIGFRLII